MSDHRCPDCKVQLPEETTIKAHKDAGAAALAAHEATARTLEEARAKLAGADAPEHKALYTQRLRAAEDAHKRTAAAAEAARRCVGRARPGERPGPARATAPSRGQHERDE